MLAKSLSAGFTLIELMISLVILAILLSLGMPAFTEILESSRTKAAASGFAMGLQRARAEAISTNRTVTFTPTGTGWTTTAPNRDSPPLIETVDVKAGGESSGGSVTVTPNTAVSFNSLGRATAGAPVNFNFSGPSGCSGEIRCLRVRVSAGGQVRVCDPAVTNTADTRSCGT